MFRLVVNSPIQNIQHPLLDNTGISVSVKREDLIHEDISGNKWRKLKYNLLEAKEKGVDTLLTFGGAYSNHISATAAAGYEFGFKTIGVIRGEEHLPLNPTLELAKKRGMVLHYLNRDTYRTKEHPFMIQKLRDQFGDFYLLPEGGTNELAVKGCEEIMDEECTQYDIVCCAMGTGGTFSGIVRSLRAHQKAIGFPALKGGEFLEEIVRKYSGISHQWNLNTSYHFGGYAKFNTPLIEFIRDFKKNTNIPLDQVYTGKMFYGVFDLIAMNQFPKGNKLLLIHTGGLQGNKGMEERFNIKL